ncbi:MAG: Crp/Fnr family transcriptional regulator [Bryobacteraceae bacterium]|nr:Crp/Fnr family transcriptional regulator [Bryobacteraceae bacterium]
MTRVADLVARVPLLSGLGQAERSALAEAAELRSFAAGELVFSEGDGCAGMYLLLTGEVQIFKRSPGGELTVSVESAPAALAELPLFDGGPYPASVRSLTPLETVFLDKAAFVSLCRQYPEIPLQLLKVVSARVRDLVAGISSVHFEGLRTRIARTLLEALPQALTHHEIATRLNTVCEVLSRDIAALESQGLVRVRGRVVEVADPERLKAEG